MHWSDIDLDTRSLLQWTLASALIWGAAFAATSVFGALISDENPLDHLGPIGVLSVIGFTVGGLVGPLARGLAARRGKR
jgi:hypothetical protein